MRHRPPFAQQAADFARNAQREQASMRRELRSLQDGVAGLQRAIKAPVPTGGARYTKTQRSNPSALSRAFDNAFRSALTGEVNGAVNLAGNGIGSFYTSSAQSALQMMDFSNDAQRIS